jgi:Invasion associated locus B (IalB) protein
MMLRLIVAPLVGTCLLASAASAAEPTSIGKYDDWEAFTYRTKDTRVCYAFSAPKKSEAAKKVKRDPIYFMVTHWPGRNVRGQISTIIGYPFKDTSTVKLSVDAKDFVLYTAGDMAWADRAETDAAILTAMKSGGALTITGTSTRGTVTTDHYSLNGISAAMDKINTACK